MNECAKKRKETRDLGKSFNDFKRARRPFRGGPSGGQANRRGRYYDKYQGNNAAPTPSHRGSHQRGGYRQNSFRGRYGNFNFCWSKGIQIQQVRSQSPLKVERKGLNAQYNMVLPRHQVLALGFRDPLKGKIKPVGGRLKYFVQNWKK